MSGNLTPEQGHTTGLPAIYEIGGEPRVLDVVLGERLGFERPREIRDLIDRNRVELEGYGNLVVMDSQEVEANLRRHTANSMSEEFAPNGANSELPFRRKRGRPSRAYLLTEDQARLTAILSRAPHAPAVRRQLIEAFNAYRANRMALRDDGRTDVVRALEGLTDIVGRQADAIAALRRRVADLEALPARRPAERIALPAPGDVLAQFLAGCTQHAEHGRVQASAIYGAWCEWCRIADLHPGSQRSFGARLGAFGLARIKSGVFHYLGLALLPKAEWARDSTAASGEGEA